MLKNKYFIWVCLLFSIIKQSYGQVIHFTEEEKEWISAHPVIEFGHETYWEPYEIYRDGVYTGIVNDYIEKIEDATGIDMIPIKDITWQESITKIKEGAIHLIPCCAITEDRKKFLTFTAPYISDPIVIATREKHEFIGSLDDLNGKSISLPKNYYTVELISRDFPEIKIITKDNINECLKSLEDGEVDAFVGSLGVISYHIYKGNFGDIKIAAPTRYKNTEIALAVTKNWKIFRDIAQKVFDSLSVKEVSSIRKEWISVRYEKGVPWKKILCWSSIIILVLFIGFLLFYYWNKSLKRQIEIRVKNEQRLKISVNKIEKQNNEKKILLQEIHHRVKNNLQIITSLIRLQANTNNNKNAVSSLNQSIDRIRAVALIHEKTFSSSSLSVISTKEYVDNLSTDIIRNFATTHPIAINIKANESTIDSSSIVPLALILNELITNSVKFGLKEKNNPKIEIDLNDKFGPLTLRYFDNGKWIENSKNNSFGSSIIEIFTEQLDGEFTLNKTDMGTEYLFQFYQQLN